MKPIVCSAGSKPGTTQPFFTLYRVLTRWYKLFFTTYSVTKRVKERQVILGLIYLITRFTASGYNAPALPVGISLLNRSSPQTVGIAPKPARTKRKPTVYSVRHKPRHTSVAKLKPVKPTPRTLAKAKVVRMVSPAKKAPVTLTIPLFGSRYARVSVSDQQLRGGIYYLSSGHGGPDPGAVGRYGKFALAEDEYAYDVTIRLARVLLSHGATVYMIVQDPGDGIRDDGVLGMDHDEVAYPHQTIPLNQLARLKQSASAVNTLYARHKKAYQRSVVIHVDSRSTGQMIDVFFYHHDRSAAGKKLATHIHRRFTAGYKRSQPGRSYLGTVSTRNTLYVVKNTLPPTVFIELGNIQNDKDQRRFVIPDNRQALANWLYEGIRSDYQSR